MVKQSSVMTRLQQLGTLNRVKMTKKNPHTFLRNRQQKYTNSCQKQKQKTHQKGQENRMLR